MTNNSDIVNDILTASYLEVVGRGLISSVEQDVLKEHLDDFIAQIDERPLTEDEIYTVTNQEYKGYTWKEQE